MARLRPIKTCPRCKAGILEREEGYEHRGESMWLMGGAGVRCRTFIVEIKTWETQSV